MIKTNTITSYLMNISELIDHILAVGDIVEDNELACISLNHISPPWKKFVESIHVQDNLPDFDYLSYGFIGEDL
jgi:hypothetical protein